MDLAKPDEITLSVDTTRLLPETDPPGRQITLSQGTFLEVLVMALREEGLHPRVEVFPDGEYGDVPDDRAVARVCIEAQPDVARDPLFAHVLRRRTNRKAFDTARGVDPDAFSELLRTELPAPAVTAGTLDRELRVSLSELASLAFETEVRTPRTWRENVDLMRIGASEIDAHRDGISVPGFLPWIGARLGQTTREKLMDPGGTAAKSAIEGGRAAASSAMGWVWVATTGNSRRDQLAAGRAYVRLHLAATRLGLAWQPMSQLLQEHAEGAELKRSFYRALGLAPGGTSVQMLARIGHASPVEPAPRRLLASIVRGA